MPLPFQIGRLHAQCHKLAGEEQGGILRNLRTNRRCRTVGNVSAFDEPARCDAPSKLGFEPHNSRPDDRVDDACVTVNDTCKPSSRKFFRAVSDLLIHSFDDE